MPRVQTSSSLLRTGGGSLLREVHCTLQALYAISVNLYPSTSNNSLYRNEAQGRTQVMGAALVPPENETQIKATGGVCCNEIRSK
jgi:hypothetical protein